MVLAKRQHVSDESREEYREEGQPGYDPEDFGETLDLPGASDDYHEDDMENGFKWNDYGCRCNIGYYNNNWRLDIFEGGPLQLKYFNVDTDDDTEDEADSNTD